MNTWDLVHRMVLTSGKQLERATYEFGANGSLTYMDERELDGRQQSYSIIT